MNDSPIRRALAAMRRHAVAERRWDGALAAAQLERRRAANRGDKANLARWHDEVQYLTNLGAAGYVALHSGDPLVVPDELVAEHGSDDWDVDENEVTVEVTLYRDTGMVFVWEPQGADHVIEGWSEEDTHRLLTEACETFEEDG